MAPADSIAAYIDRASAVRRQQFGRLPGGRLVEAITLGRAPGIEATILTYGATLQALVAPDAGGHRADVVLGHGSLEPYLEQPQYFGSTVGRVANRIAGGRFELDGVRHQVPPNDGANALHGGASGFDKANWRVVSVSSEPCPQLVLAHLSPDGDQGFPGALDTTATFSITAPDTLALDYRATCDRPTLVNITTHAYWNLAGEGAAAGAMGHHLHIPAAHFLPTDAGAIPTGEVRAVAGTPFDFRKAGVIGDRVRRAEDDQILIGRGYDHNWVVRREVAPAPGLMAMLRDPGSGRRLELFSNQPGLQFYSGNFLDGSSVGKSGRAYRMGDAVALEPQMFPDTPNQPDFGTLRLDPGDTYLHRILFRFSAMETKG